MGVLKFDNVYKTFRSRSGGEVRALKGLSFVAKEGHITCLLGTTGCGKTTALRIAAGLESPESGSAFIGDFPVEEQKTRMAFIPQQHTLFPWARLDDNVAFPLRIKGISRAERIIVAGGYLKLVGLAGREKMFPHECSGGMLQRAMLARQLASGLHYWLMDEPFAALDERTRNNLQDLLIALRDEKGLSILFVTHSIEEAAYLADRIVLLLPGVDNSSKVFDMSDPRPRNRMSPEFVERMNAVRAALHPMGMV